jgi:phage terminase large subunit-like protein
VRWIEENMIFAEGDSFGKPVRLRRDQKLFIYRWYEWCPSCEWWHYDEALRGEARGGGKTALVAMIADLEFGGPPQIAPYSPNVVIAAASWDQANLLYSAAATMLGGRDQEVTQAPLCGYFEVYDAQITFADNRPGRLFRTATVAGTNQGGQPTTFMADEIHEFGDVEDARARFHKVVAMGTKKRTLTYFIPGSDGQVREVKRGPGRVINLSTAGFDVDHSFLGAMYKRGMREAQQQVATRFLFDWAQAPDDIDYTDPAQRAMACRAASGAADQIWSVAARVAEWDKDEVLKHEWIRYYANRWVDVAEESWLSEHPGAWAACKGAWDIGGDEPAVLAIDMALKRDSVAVAEVRMLPADEQHPDGRFAVTCRIWYPSNGQIPHLEVFEYIEQRAKELGTAFQGLVFDPRYFQLPAEQLEDKGHLAIQFDQSPQRMAPAVGLAYDLILSGGIVHNGDVELGSQVKAAVRKQWERGFTLSKGKSRRHIDACVAMCMGVWTLAELAGQNEPSILDQIW